MSIYELRTYTLQVGKMGEAAEAYKNLGWPVFERVGEGRCLAYFTGDVGAMNQIIHIWKFADDADRRAFWGRLYADEGFKTFAGGVPAAGAGAAEQADAVGALGPDALSGRRSAGGPVADLPCRRARRGAEGRPERPCRGRGRLRQVTQNAFSRSLKSSAGPSNLLRPSSST